MSGTIPVLDAALASVSANLELLEQALAAGQDAYARFQLQPHKSPELLAALATLGKDFARVQEATDFLWSLWEKTQTEELSPFFPSSIGERIAALQQGLTTLQTDIQASLESHRYSRKKGAT